jgi:hypothetical protein
MHDTPQKDDFCDLNRNQGGFFGDLQCNSRTLPSHLRRLTVDAPPIGEFKNPTETN